MARPRVEMNSRGVIEVYAEVRTALRGHAARVAARARSTAPVDTGAYRDSIHVEDATLDGVPAVIVVADAPHSGIVEATTGNLSRALGTEGG